MQQGLKNSNSSKMRWLYVLMSIDIDVCFCLNVLIKSQETFVFSKTILQVFSFKEVFTKMWHQISYYFINYPTLLLTNRTLEYNWKPFYPPGPFFNFLIPICFKAYHVKFHLKLILADIHLNMKVFYSHRFRDIL